MTESRRAFLTEAPLAAALGLTVVHAASANASPAGTNDLNVADYGAVGDGSAPCADAFQKAIDAAEKQGGGVVRIPPGTFLLERTPLIASRVHLMGAGSATVLKGQRPQGSEGAALISNKGQEAPGFSGAHDWSISHLTIDSPDTNGIVITHAARVYVGFIYGAEVYHHFVDIVGTDILCENLFLTGRSGTSSFQIDSVSSAQTIWDGAQAVAPLRDDTNARNLILRSSFITALAGHNGKGPQHDASVHFHGEESQGFQFSDLVLGGASTGFYQDPGSAYHDVRISNVRCANPGRAVWLNPGGKPQQRLMIHGLSHAPERGAFTGPYRGLEIHGRSDALLSDIQLDAEGYETTDFGILIEDAQQVRLSGIHARGRSGRAVLLRDGAGKMEQVLLQNGLFKGFETGCAYEGGNADAILARDNLFSDVACPYVGISE